MRVFDDLKSRPNEVPVRAPEAPLRSEPDQYEPLLAVRSEVDRDNCSDAGDRTDFQSSTGGRGYSGAGCQTQPGSGRVTITVQAHQRVQYAFTVD
jgi:hypothetical protein